MSNHYHLVVYFDPKAPNQWTDLEVAERWLKAYPGKLDKPKYQQQRELRLQAIINNQKQLKTIRNRLGSLSWLMSRINEPIAKGVIKRILSAVISGSLDLSHKHY
ncbi:MAG: hypothetical protein Q9M92_03400 [Enterobacterales bacterium]|nr:hypothetical protein [Enterobacterales bacterium]